MESTLRVNNKTGLCEIIVESEETIKVHRKLANILGFIDKVEFANVGNTPSLPRAYAGDVVPDINLLTFSLYIYSDIVYPTRVGKYNCSNFRDHFTVTVVSIHNILTGLFLF